MPGNVRPEGPQCGEAGSTVPSSHGRGGLEGVRPSSSHISHLAAAVRVSPYSRSHPAEVGNFRLSTDFSHLRRGLEGARPSSSHEQHFPAEVLYSAPIPTVPRGRKPEISPQKKRA